MSGPKKNQGWGGGGVSTFGKSICCTIFVNDCIFLQVKANNV